MVFLVIDGITHWPRILILYKKTLLSETTSVPGLLKGAEINFSAYAPVEIAKAPQGSIGLCSFRNRSLFWGFEWNERSNNPERSSNVRYRIEPQYIL